MAADDLARRRRRSRPARSARPPWRARKPALPTPARKQRSWLSALSATGEAGGAGDLADLGLGQLAEREAQPARAPPAAGRRACRSGPWPGRRRRSSSAPSPSSRGPRVMAGGEPGGAEALGDLDHRRDPDPAVAAHARVRRLARRVAGEERLDDAGPERLAEIDGQMRDALRLRDRAGDADGVGGAAAALAVVGRIGPELERDRDHLGAPLPLPQRRDGAVDAAADGDQHPLAAVAGRRQDRPGGAGDRGPERPVQRLGGEVGGVGADRAESARAPRRPPRRRAGRPRAAPRRRAARAAAAPAARAAAQPLASMRTSATLPPSSRSESATRSPQAAPPARPPGSAGDAARRAASRRRGRPRRHSVMARRVERARFRGGRLRPRSAYG